LEEITDAYNASLTGTEIDVIGILVVITTTPSAIAGICHYRW
jgi:hypothetical protein